jgi:hypothetical protein
MMASARQDGLSADEQADLILHCAYLVAVGDAHLAEEELSHLSLLRGEIRRVLSARGAIEAVECSGNFETAKSLFDPSTPVRLSIEGIIGVPPAMMSLHQARQDLATQEELVALEQQYAAKITDPYLQKVAYYFCIQVASADDDFADAEHQTLRILGDVWGLSHGDAVDWYNIIAFPVLTGEDPLEALGEGADARGGESTSEQQSEEETAAELRRLLGLDDPSEEP